MDNRKVTRPACITVGYVLGYSQGLDLPWWGVIAIISAAIAFLEWVEPD